MTLEKVEVSIVRNEETWEEVMAEVQVQEP